MPQCDPLHKVSAGVILVARLLVADDQVPTIAWWAEDPHRRDLVMMAMEEVSDAFYQRSIVPTATFTSSILAKL